MAAQDEAERSAADALLRTFFESAAFPVGVVELRGEEIVVVHVNRAAASFMGLDSPEEMVGKTAREVGATQERMAIWLKHYRQSEALQTPVTFEMEWVHRGRPLVLSVTVSPAHDPRAAHRYCFVAQEVTELRRAMQALTASEERLEFALDVAEEGIWDWNIPMDSVWLSPKCFEQLGFPAAKGGTRESWFARIHRDERAASEAALDEHLAGRSDVYAVEHRVRHSDGRYVWLLSRGKVVARDKAGNPLRMIGSQLLITERKRFEAELQQANEAAQSASAAKSAFVANVSHEIRTPLTAILGYADLLLDETLSPQEQRQFAETIRRSGRHLLALINDVLDFSKMDAAKVRMERVACAPGTIASEVTMLMQSRAEAKRLRYTVREVPPLPRLIQTDPMRARQILLNLLDNAIKFTREGSVELTLRLDSDQSGNGGPGEGSGKEIETGRFCFDVTDSGIGITGEEIARLFTPFEQADASTTRRFGGTGLGLSISQRLAQLLGGGIDVNSTVGKGSRFTFWLPVSMPAVASEAQPALEAPVGAIAGEGPERGARVLLVEDNVDIQFLVRHVLEKQGARVDLANDGGEGVSLACEAQRAGAPFDLVLMDVQMPVLDGYEATRMLRAAGVRVPVVALTADAMDGRREESLAAGCDDFFAKPIDILEMLAMVRRHLAHRQVEKK
jgi:PAS domain S-box-containing protein